MELANAMLNLAGDLNQQVQKWRITPAEAAVLRAIHGDDALHSLKVIGTVDRSNRFEYDRLVQTYGKGLDGNVTAPVVDALFPGLGARLPARFADLPGIRTDSDVGETEEVFTPIGDGEAAETNEIFS